MSHTLPPNVLAVADELERSAGGYLQSTIREPGVTCEVCGTPIEAPWRYCFHCNAHKNSGLLLADRVGSLIYAVKQTQSYLMVYNYKTLVAGPSLERQVTALLALGLRGHTRCAEELAGAHNTAWAVVPSTRGRSKLHNLVSRLANRKAQELQVAYVGHGSQGRSLQPELWKVSAPRNLPDHVILVDDSWVTGAHAQSVASAIKSVGIPMVSIFTIANVLEPDWHANRQFIRERLHPPVFDKERCPWTGGSCP
jgi:predicted amidophosphoribosyltransferase